MEFEHNNKMYPPKVAITTRDLSSVQNIIVHISNLEEDDVDMDVTLGQGTCHCFILPGSYKSLLPCCKSQTVSMHLSICNGSLSYFTVCYYSNWHRFISRSKQLA